MSRGVALKALAGFVFAAIFLNAASAAIWPDKLGENQLKSTSSPAAGATQDIWVEDGLDGAETADYGAFQATAWRFKDTTGAYAASLESKGVRVGNYVVECRGRCPGNLAELADKSLPRVSHTSIPTLSSYLPARGKVPDSERYVLGPMALQSYAPKISAAAIDFDLSTEGELARYRIGSANVTLAVFSFPSPSLARQQLAEFQKIAGAEAKRAGPLVIVAFAPPAVAAKLLDGIDYQGVVAENEKPPVKPLELKPESAGHMIIAIISLAGLLLGFCLLSGLAVGGSLWYARRFGYSAAEGSLIKLHLESK